MNFKLLQHKSTKALVTFHVLNSKDEVCGSVNVAPEEADVLRAHWRGSHAAPVAKPGVKAVRLPAMSKKAILRGC